VSDWSGTTTLGLHRLCEDEAIQPCVERYGLPQFSAVRCFLAKTGGVSGVSLIRTLGHRKSTLCPKHSKSSCPFTVFARSERSEDEAIQPYVERYGLPQFSAVRWFLAKMGGVSGVSLIRTLGQSSRYGYLNAMDCVNLGAAHRLLAKTGSCQRLSPCSG
jgi:hypothetical protein